MGTLAARRRESEAKIQQDFTLVLEKVYFAIFPAILPKIPFVCIIISWIQFSS